MPKRTLAIGLLLPLLVGCGAGTVPESGVEVRTQEQLAAMHDDVGEVECPGDLDAEVGATMECRATIDGVERGVTVEVTEVEDDNAVWQIDVEE